MFIAPKEGDIKYIKNNLNNIKEGDIKYIKNNLNNIKKFIFLDFYINFLSSDHFINSNLYYYHHLILRPYEVHLVI